MARLALALSRSLKGLAIEAEDGAAVELAKHYAKAIDEAEALEGLAPYQVGVLKEAGLNRYVATLDTLDALKRLGPELLAALAELGMTPKARKAVVKGNAEPDGGSDKITELRSRRERRAAHLDAASS